MHTQPQFAYIVVAVGEGQQGPLRTGDILRYRRVCYLAYGCELHRGVDRGISPDDHHGVTRYA